MTFILTFLITVLVVILIFWCILFSNNLDKSIYIDTLNSPIDRTLDKKLRKALRKGIKDISRDICRLKITFRDGTVGEFWNCDKWYEWLREGILIPTDGNAYIWSYKRPTRRTMIKFKKAIEKYYR